MSPMLRIPKLERDGDTVTVSFTYIIAPSSRKFRQLRECTHDSDEVPHDINPPLLRANGRLLESTGQLTASSSWAFQVPLCSAISILYAGLEYDCGEV